jgi:hypothetical protein
MKKITTYNIAVCLSGQSRTWRAAKENIINYFDVKINKDKNCKVNVDYFIHTWDTNSYRNKTQPRWENVDCKIDNPNEESEIKFAFKPKLMEYETYNSDAFLEAWEGMFYSFMKSVELKRRYELMKDMTYDMVIKTRFDINFPQEGVNKFGLPINKFYVHSLKPFTAYASSPTPTRFPNEFNQVCFDDVFFYGDSTTMDITAQLYRWYKKIMNVGREQKVTQEFVQFPEFYYGPGTLLYKYLTNWNIHPYAEHANPYYVVRKEAEDKGLHSINDWQEIFNISKDWYENGYFDKSKSDVN